MKRPLYTIADEEFVTLLERTHSAFENENLKYMFVGGVATQAHIIDSICKNGKTLIDFVDSPDFRLQDHLRATDDVDITLSPQKNGATMTDEERVNYANKVYAVLGKIVEKGEFISPTENHLVSLSLERKGISRPIFMLGLDGKADPEKTASFNLYKGPEDSNDRWGPEIRDFERRFYHDFMDRRTKVAIPFCAGKSIDIYVKKPEDLLATKIVRARDKDWSDILSLVRHKENSYNPINYKELKDLLCGDDPIYQKPNQAFVEKYEKFMGLKDASRGED